MKRKINKIIAMIMLLIILINSLPIQAFATFITDMNSNAFFGVIPNSYQDYKHEMHYCNYDGVDYLLFCAEYNKPSVTNTVYEYNNGFWIEYKEQHENYSRIAEMICFGYTMNYGAGLPNSIEAQRAAACTQQYVWEQLGNAPRRDSWNSNYMSESIYASWLNQTESYYNHYHGDNVSFNNTSYNMKAGESLFITDTNSILQEFGDFSSNINGVTFFHSRGSNDMTIYASEDSVGSLRFNSSENNIYQLLPNGNTFNRDTMSSYLYFQFNSGVIQNLMFSNYLDPVFFVLNLNVEPSKGNVKIKKTNNLGNPVADCTFELYSDANCTNKVATGKSNSSGEITFEKLNPGTFYVKETSVVKGYLIDNSVKSVNVTAGQTATVDFKNNEPTGEILIYKVNENGDKIGGAEFKIIADEDIYNVAKTKKYYSKGEEVATITTEAGTGMASKSSLPIGRYSIFESQAPFRLFIK